MASVHDVAAYILKQHQGAMSTWKLQKLVYYSQAWHLAWDEEPLFSEPIEAWANGPVVRKLYNVHRGRFQIGTWPRGNADKLTKDERETIDAVLSFYGDKTGHWLSELTHSEPPWREARRGLDRHQRGERRIKRGDMADYYGQLVVTA
ncbi:MAG: type II toxin-antitoxin system antitoxin SocA domain-containing protein [Actinomycetota bacterium]